MKVSTDSDGDGTSFLPDGPDEGTEPDVEPRSGQSGDSPPGTNETTTFVRPETGDGRLEPGEYVVRVVNYATVTPTPTRSRSPSTARRSSSRRGPRPGG